MLIKANDFLKPSEGLSKPHRGVVMNNDDPDRLRRVKAVIAGRLAGTIDKLPWIYPRRTSNDVKIPSLGSEIEIIFPYGDIYSGFYIGSWESTLTQTGPVNEDYPNTYGSRDEQGQQFTTNKAKKISEYLHPSGFGFQVESDGSVTIKGPRKLNFQSADGKTSLILDFETGKITTNQAGEQEDTGDIKRVTVDELIETVGNKTTEVSGGLLEEVLGGVQRSTGGSLSESTTGNRGESVGGQKTSLVALKKTETIGLGLTQTVITGPVEKTALVGPYDIRGLIVSLNKVLGGFGISTFSDPIEDLTSGKPKIGVPTVQIG